MMRPPIRRLMRGMHVRLERGVAGPLGRLRNPHQVVARRPEDGIALGPKIVLFLHWDSAGKVREALFHYIGELAETGRSVVFITNSGCLDPVAETRLAALCAGIMVRRNIGYDFGGWRDAIETLDLPRADTQEIIIANDSVFGPVRPLAPLLDCFDYETADVWGLTDSWQSRYHLQSYFVGFGPRAIRAQAFRDFWRRVIPAPSKSYVIGTYEVGLTQAMLRAGLRAEALWRYEDMIRQIDREGLVPYLDSGSAGGSRIDPVDLTRSLHVLRLRDAIARRQPLNPTADLWRHLLRNGYPFLKRELLRDNPTRIEDVGDWTRVLRDELGVDPAPIVADLRTMLKDLAP